MSHDSTNLIEITYTAAGFDEAGETSFQMYVANNICEKLQEAENEGEYLDSAFISGKHKALHKKILREIRKNMQEEGLNPDDGMIEKQLPWGATYMEDRFEASHTEMSNLASDDDIQYTVAMYL